MKIELTEAERIALANHLAEHQVKRMDLREPTTDGEKRILNRFFVDEFSHFKKTLDETKDY
jgi:hypothetical protein